MCIRDRHGTASHESDWLLQAAADRLRQFGVPPSEIARLEQTGAVQHDVTIDSPASGYITEFNALPNQYVQPETKLYTIADLSTVWVNANVFQTGIGALKPGMPATVTVDAYPGRTFKGRIDQVLPQVDVTTRTAPVRLVFNNPGIALKPGMYVNVSTVSYTHLAAQSSWTEKRGPCGGNCRLEKITAGSYVFAHKPLSRGRFPIRQISNNRKLCRAWLPVLPIR